MDKDKEKALKSMPYFMDWLQELNRPIDDVETIILEGETRELSAEEKLAKGDTAQWRAFEPTGFMTVRMAFLDGQLVKRRVPNGTVTYMPQQEEAK